MIEIIKKIILLLQRCLRYPKDKLLNNRVPFNSRVQPHTYLRNCKIGRYCYIGDFCDISYAEIGNYTCIANGVIIGGMEHPYWDLSISPEVSENYVYGKTTYIGYDVWIATGCIIKQGVHIGNGAVIGANSFVTKDVPPYAIVFGTPAKIHKYRFDESLANVIEKSHYYDYPPEKAKQILNVIKTKFNSNE